MASLFRKPTRTEFLRARNRMDDMRGGKWEPRRRTPRASLRTTAPTKQFAIFLRALSVQVTLVLGCAQLAGAQAVKQPTQQPTQSPVVVGAVPVAPVIPNVSSYEVLSLQSGTVFAYIEQGRPDREVISIPVKVGERNGLVKFESVPGKHRPSGISTELRTSAIHLIRLGGTNKELTPEQLQGVDQMVDRQLGRKLALKVDSSKVTQPETVTCLLSQSDRPLWIVVTDLYLQSGNNMSDISYIEKTTVFNALCSSQKIQPGFDLLPVQTYNTNQGVVTWVQKASSEAVPAQRPSTKPATAGPSQK